MATLAASNEGRLASVIEQALETPTLGDQIKPRTERMQPSDWPEAPYLSLEHIEAHTTRILGHGRAGDMKSTCFVYREGDVLYGRLRPYLNKVAVAQGEGLCSGEFIVFPGDKLGDGRYLKYRLNAPDFLRYTAILDTGDRPRVKWAGVSKFQTELPDKDTQVSVAEYLETQFSRLADAQASLQRAKVNLERYRRSVLHAAGTGRLVLKEAEPARAAGRDDEPADQLLERILIERRVKWEEAEIEKAEAKGKELKGESWKKRYKEPVAPDLDGLPELPQGWCWATVDQMSSMVTDGEHQTPPRTEEGVLLLSARNVHNDRLDLSVVDHISAGTHESLCQRLKIQAGDVLLSCSGTVGRTCLVPKGLEFSLVRSVAVIRPLLGLGEYLQMSLQAPFLQGQMNAKKSQTAQANLFQGKIRSLVVPLPPEAEIQKVMAMARDQRIAGGRLDSNITQAERKVHYLRQSILQSIFQSSNHE